MNNKVYVLEIIGRREDFWGEDYTAIAVAPSRNSLIKWLRKNRPEENPGKVTCMYSYTRSLGATRFVKTLDGWHIEAKTWSGLGYRIREVEMV